MALANRCSTTAAPLGLGGQTPADPLGQLAQAGDVDDAHGGGRRRAEEQGHRGAGRGGPQAVQPGGIEGSGGHGQLGVEIGLLVHP
jgi:hypothetical protein